MKLYKLTDQNHKTFNGKCFWEEGTTHSLPKTESPQLCSGGVIHAYTNKNLAFLLNPIHGDYDNPVLWSARGRVVVKDFGKVGCFELTTTKRLRSPSWVNSEKEQSVNIMFAVLCAEAVLVHFTDRFPGDERPQRAITAAREYLKTPSADVAARAAEAAAGAAEAAARAAEAAARAATWAAEAAARAVDVAARVAAEAAAGAADVAARVAWVTRAARAADVAARVALVARASTWVAWAARAAEVAAIAAGTADVDFGKLADKAVLLTREQANAK